jgi:hypothetical protein
MTSLALASARAWGRVKASDIRAAMPVQAIKSADESVTSSTTLQNDDELALALLAGVEYRISGLVILTGAAAAGGAAIAFTWPAGVTVEWSGSGLAIAGGANVNAIRNTSGTSSPFGTSGATPVPAFIEGTVFPAPANFTLQTQWAQSASNATATVVKLGSRLRADPA